jgi:hypothetical protein
MKISTLLSSLVFTCTAAFSLSSFAQATKDVGATMEGAPGMKPSISADHRISRLDKNKDGQISKDEANSNPKMLKRFDVIDGNKDGQLTRDELKAFKEKRKEERGMKGKHLQGSKPAGAGAPAAANPPAAK